MKTIIKLLLTLSTTTTIGQQAQVISAFSQQENNIEVEEFKLEREPNILFQTPLDINRKFKFIPKYELGDKIDFNRFISLEELNLDYAKEYFYDSKIELSFTKPAVRSSNGYGINEIYQDAYFTNEFDFKVKLEKEETYKVIQKDFTYYDEVNGFFIYTQLNLTLTRIVNQFKSGLQLDGTIKEALKWEPWAKQRAITSKMGRDLNGVMVLTNLNMNFSARKDQFKDIAPEQKNEIPLFESRYNINEGNWLFVLQNILGTTKEAAKYYGLEPYETGSKIVWQKFNPKTKTRRVCFGLYHYKDQIFIRENLIADIKFNNSQNEVRFIQVTNEFKNYEDSVTKTKKLISNQFDIDSSKIIFNPNTSFNKQYLTNWPSLAPRLEFFVNYNNKSVRFEVYYKNTKITVEKNDLSFEDIYFNLFDSKRTIDKEQVLESNKGSDSFEFKDLKLTANQIELESKQSKAFFITNGNQFRNITFTSSKNINVEKINSSKFIITSLNNQNGWVEFDSIDAIKNQRLDVKILTSNYFFEVDNQELEFDTNTTGIIKINTNHLKDIKIINSNIELKIIQTNDILNINCKIPGNYIFKLYSEIIDEFINIKVNIIKSNNLISANNYFYINKVNTQGQIVLNNIYSDEYDYLNINCSNKNLFIQQIDNNIYFWSNLPGEYSLQVSLNDYNFIIPIYFVSKFVEKVDNINLVDNLHFNHYDYNLLEVRNLDYTLENDEYNFYQVDKNKESMLKLIDKNGNIITKHISNKQDSKNSNKYKIIIPSILIPFSFGIAGLIFVWIKKIANKKDNK